MMTGRSFKPCSTSLSLRPQRPSYTRTSSASSTRSIRSQNQDRPSSSASVHSEVSESTPVQEPVLTAKTNSPRKSRPIAIELPPRRSSVQINTPTPPPPLSGRGEKPGGYFPFHEDIPRSYKAHPFHYDPPGVGYETQFSMPQSESSHYTGQQQQHHHHHHHHPTSSTPVMDSIAAMSSPVPVGKYHPSNYKARTKETKRATPTAAQPHKRQSSEVKKKIQQYQRDIMEQAARAAGISVPGQNSPERPKLAPLGSPGPVTPFELEESAGYLVAGMGSRGANQDQHELIARLIEQERSRKAGRTSPVRSPIRSPHCSPVVKPMS